MLKKIILGAFVGGIIAYIWLSISWMALPWHQKTLKSFKNEGFVSWVLKENAPKKGIYVLPHYSSYQQQEEGVQQPELKGPFVFASVTPKGTDPKNPIPYIAAFVFQVFLSGLLCYFLYQLKPQISYFARIRFLALVALFAGIAMKMPEWTWWNFSLKFILLDIADLIISWTLAGLFIAKITRYRQQKETEESSL
ncbi:MAG: hypothetical protein Tsb0015_15660 [Simkaniaceae bacterium]